MQDSLRRAAHAQTDVQAAFAQARTELLRRLVGREALIDRLLIALLAGGHLLVEGAPGLAKTRAVKLFAETLSTRFARIQATPDLLPSDLTGADVLRPQTGSFEFSEGPLFNNVVLVDEINRAPPKVQSALLEAMAEGQITHGGVTRRLAPPFLVAATQNPLEHEGVYPLPEAQLDRFLFYVTLEMPDALEERAILDLALEERLGEAEKPKARALIDLDAVLTAKQAAAEVHVSPAVRDFIVRLVAATRGVGAAGEAAADIAHPASPRGSLGLAAAAQARAWLLGRDHVLPADVEELALDALSGRIGLSYRARAEGKTARGVMAAILQRTPVL
ncbi:MoxR family ATPase [Neomegalonema sp.]|uniref:AAA family ATPase n=1 Tax=Neomegalonema sp. TaxID=2039713 RepID=UPI0026036108|nr:AAA family ATPase [Neomegalonema sp.]MDD2867352.1 AAA family ATPase [Neomegalonema sp.]